MKRACNCTPVRAILCWACGSNRKCMSGYVVLLWARGISESFTRRFNALCGRTALIGACPLCAPAASLLCLAPHFRPPTFRRTVPTFGFLYDGLRRSVTLMHGRRVVEGGRRQPHRLGREKVSGAKLVLLQSVYETLFWFRTRLTHWLSCLESSANTGSAQGALEFCLLVRRVVYSC